MSAAVPEGLCRRCEHRRRITGAGGSRFVLCALSRRDDRFPRYPRLPVLECPGFSPREAPPEGPASGRPADEAG